MYMFIFLRILLCTMCTLAIVAANRPPHIYSQTDDKEIFFVPGQSFQLLCKAEGVPKPKYSWRHNGLEYVVDYQDGRVMQLPDQGTLVFDNLGVRDEGIFQCFADNGYGVSVSSKVYLRAARLEPFPDGLKWTYRVNAGYHLTIPCTPPMSYPYGNVIWTIRDSEGSWRRIDVDDRVNVDLEGRLRFTNVIKPDERDGNSYVCMVQNQVLSAYSFGTEHVIQVVGDYQFENPVEPLFISPTDSLFLKGEDLVLSCIFSGSPTPVVRWSRIDKEMSKNAKVMHGRLTIKNVQFSDGGIYECVASNANSTRLAAFIVRIDSAPYWVNKPVNTEAKVSDSATFTCLAAGIPGPKYTWYINGVHLKNGVRDPRIYQNSRFRRTNESSITLTNLTPEDHMNIQCNASNKHGYVFSDVFLNVSVEFNATEVEVHTTEAEVKTTEVPFYDIYNEEVYSVDDLTEQVVERLRLLEHQVRDQGRLIAQQQNQILQLEAARENQTICNQCTSSSSPNNATDSKNDSSPAERVAFSAYLNKPIDRLGFGHPIVYNVVLYDEGSAYDSHNGIFTCPVDGVYVVHFSVYTFGRDQVVARLFINGTGQVDAIADTIHRYHEAQGSNLVVTDLKQGQQVWVSNYIQFNQTDDDFITHRYATFSAFLLHQ